jgi:CheY-like chemotaxis protein
MVVRPFIFQFQNQTKASMNPKATIIKNILLAEDDPLDVELTLTALEEHHLANQIEVVNNGAEALDYLYRRGNFSHRTGGNPILVLLDLKMPKVSGLEVLKIIKADAQLKIIPVVVLSSSREMPDLVQCYQHGVNAYVVKPVDFGEFVDAVKQLGIFWAAVNEPPPSLRREEPHKTTGPEKKEDYHGIPAPYPASGG